MNILAVTAFRRPDYTRDIMRAINAADGSENWTVILCIDLDSTYTTQQIKALAKSECKRPHLRIISHPTHLGCNLNIHAALTECFEPSYGANFVALIEDDVLIYPDALNLLNWMSSLGRDKNLFTAGIWRASQGYGDEPKSDCPHEGPGDRDPYPDEAFRLTSQPGFRPWGWGIWRDRWNELKDNWASGDDRNDSWDFHLGRVQGDRHQLLPMISRATNIGEHSGTHRGAARLKVWMGNFNEGVSNVVSRPTSS